MIPPIATGDAGVFIDSDLNGLDAAQEARAALTMLLRTMEHLPQSHRGTEILKIAAELIETAAYDLAGIESPPRVARLILMSAEVARVATGVKGENELVSA